MFSPSVLLDSAPPRSLRLPNRRPGPVRLGEILDRILELRAGPPPLAANEAESSPPPEFPRAA